jgi:DHA1 family tetracycline resistance protein-like MFS transporter
VTARSIRRRFLLLRALRWIPTGLLMPVLVLLLLERGLTLGQVGLSLGAQSLVVMLLELPTGGLADSLGRQTVLLAASAFDLVSIGLLIVADTFALIVAVFVLQGVYRALESGPLDAWFVDSAQAVDPDTDIGAAMGASGAVIGVAIASGSVGGSLIVASDPISGLDALVVPLIVSLVLRAVEILAISKLMIEPVSAELACRPRASRLVRDALIMIRTSNALVALLIIEALWGAGMIAFETFTPARLAAVLDDPDGAAAILGPAAAGAWLLSAGSAAAVPTLARRAGAPLVGFCLRIFQGVTVIGIAVSTGPAGVVAAYLATMAVHGAANPVHQGLLHRAVTDSGQRATVLSANSLAGSLGGAVGAIGLGMIADASTLSTAVLVGAVLLAVAAPLYLRMATVSPQRLVEQARPL